MRTVAPKSLELDCGICRLRTLRMDDDVSIAQYANNRNVAANLRDRFPHPYTIDDARTFISSALQNEAAGPLYRSEFVLAIEVQGMAVGAIGLIFFDDIERCAAELGYWLGEPYWGRGIVSTATRVFSEWAMREFQLTRIFAKPFADNMGSIRALEKAGFTQEARLRKAAIKNGKSRDYLLFALVK